MKWVSKTFLLLRIIEISFEQCQIHQVERPDGDESIRSKDLTAMKVERSDGDESIRSKDLMAMKVERPDGDEGRKI